MEFKGTPGEWKTYQNASGDIEIDSKYFKKLALVNFYPDGFREKYINGKITGSPAPNSDNFRKECLYNAKLISCAPEMIELLIELKEELSYYGGSDLPVISRADELIKKATE